MRPFVILSMLVSVAAQAEGSRESVTVFYPGVAWQLRYELPDVLEQYNNHEPGVSSYAFAISEKTGMTVSVQIASADGAANASRCREDDLARMRAHPKFGNPRVRFIDTATTDLEVVVEVPGQGASRHVHRYWQRDGVCAKLHASKLPFVAADEAVFTAIFNSARFEPASSSIERGFVLPGRGTLLLSSPTAWGFRTGKPGTGPRDITFLFADGNHRLMLTVFPDANRALRGATTRAYVEGAREKSKGQVLESDAPLEEIAGRAATGYYFTVTDKDLVGKPPQRENWKYMRQGALVAGEAFLIFSLFSNERESPEVQAGLALVREARFDAAQ